MFIEWSKVISQQLNWQVINPNRSRACQLTIQRVNPCVSGDIGTTVNPCISGDIGTTVNPCISGDIYSTVADKGLG